MMAARPKAGRGNSLSRTLLAATYINPVFDIDFPDPTVIRASDGYYYAYATQAIVGGRTLNIQVARSRDLVKWEHLGDALPVKPAWADKTQKFWGLAARAPKGKVKNFKPTLDMRIQFSIWLEKDSHVLLQVLNERQTK